MQPESPPTPSGSSFGEWTPSLSALADDLARILQHHLHDAHGRGIGSESLARPVAVGAGDVTFGIDVPAERRIEAWHAEIASRRPLSVLTEDAGWRHRVPDGAGGSRPSDGFDHGGPRIAFDPIDGTRNLMADLRSAWTVISFAGPGPGEPRLSDLTGGVVSELPTRRESVRRTFHAERDGDCHLVTRSTGPEARELDRTRVVVDRDDRADHGYFPFFRYQPALRPAIAHLEAEFLRRLVAHEGAEDGSLYDDQYITNAGQLVLTSLGTYRVFVDARPFVAERVGVPTTTAKPYDVAGAIVVAQAAGAVVTDLEGEPLEFPIDCRTPIAFAAWANRPTYERLLPHLRAALEAVPRA